MDTADTISQQPQVINAYDGRDFLLLTPDPLATGSIYLQLLDSAGLPLGAPARIGGANKGPNHRYVLDPFNTGHAADYIYNGPVIGEELDRAMASPEPFPSPIFAKGRVADPALGADISQSASTLVGVLAASGAANTSSTTPTNPAPSHVILPAKSGSALVRFLEKIPHETEAGVKDAVTFLKTHLHL